MTSITAVYPHVWSHSLKSLWAKLRTPFWEQPTKTIDAPEDARSRQEFIQEMLDRNPDAFTSEADVQTMMQIFPQSF